MKKLAKTLVLLCIPFLASCEPNAEINDEIATEKRLLNMRNQVGLPAISNFTEARFAKQISELRDQHIKTWTYYLDINGKRHLLCESIGFGLPYSVQLTNPMQRGGSGGITLPQAEPNGLYMPDQADATWVLCSDGKGGVAPVYSEPHLLVSPFPLGHVDAAENSGFADTVQVERITTEVAIQK